MLGADWGPLTNDDADIETIARHLIFVKLLSFVFFNQNLGSKLTFASEYFSLHVKLIFTKIYHNS
jgi:hypothetical protein